VRRFAVVLLTLAALASAAPANAIVGGAVDSRYASCGQATGLVPRAIAGRQFSYGAGASLAAQPDGKVVAAGPAARGMGATRFNADGTLDTSFGGDGVAFIPLPSSTRNDQTQVAAVAVQPDGKVVVAGWERTNANPNDVSSPLVEFMLVARFTPGGEPDPSFSGDGLFKAAPFGSGSASARGVAVAQDGGLIVAGQVDGRFALIRLFDDGLLDPGFGEGGVARVATAARPNGSAEAVAVVSGGRILAAGQTNAEFRDQAFTVARLNATGAPDPALAGTGALTETLDETSFASALVTLPDGRFYAVGTTIDQWGDDEGGGTTRRAAVIRYLENGERDDAFAGDGSVLDAFGQGLYATVSPTAAALDADGRLAVATERGPLARYTPAGARDPAFGLGGRLRIFSAPTGESLVTLPDGALVLGGGNERQGSRPTGFEWGPAIMRLAGGGQALEGAKGQGAACFLRVRNTSLPHLLRRGSTARNGKVIVGALLTQPGSGILRATGIDSRGAFGIGATTYSRRDAGSTSFEIPMRARAHARLSRVSSVRVVVDLIPAGDPDVITATAKRTLRR
jgi:uncharacterized delta-60 repeat protein